MDDPSVDHSKAESPRVLYDYYCKCAMDDSLAKEGQFKEYYYVQSYLHADAMTELSRIFKSKDGEYRYVCATCTP